MDGTKYNAMKVWIRYKKLFQRPVQFLFDTNPGALHFPMSSISPFVPWHHKVPGLNCASRAFYTQELNEPVSFNSSLCKWASEMELLSYNTELEVRQAD